MGFEALTGIGRGLSDSFWLNHPGSCIDIFQKLRLSNSLPRRKTNYIPPCSPRSINGWLGFHQFESTYLARYHEKQSQYRAYLWGWRLLNVIDIAVLKAFRSSFVLKRCAGSYSSGGCIYESLITKRDKARAGITV